MVISGQEVFLQEVFLQELMSPWVRGLPARVDVTSGEEVFLQEAFLQEDPLEDFDGYRSSANTHPHKQHLYGLLDSIMHTSRNCVTNYIHMSLTSSYLDGNLHDLISAIDSSILSVDCVEWLAAGCPVVGREMLATEFIALKCSCDWYNILRLNA
ncbi:hypothetical protein F511_25066 [Dorcoceras hygrometricum]|uniref:Uncharacterized protein n=1 Tax=Dorcoceras hygrometricum TaxID=472368 RepID=A0A2Z7C763_9LAMI|nr:hypothetical protein F511_25066 [Dorcoceras hygrometricum]